MDELTWAELLRRLAETLRNREEPDAILEEIETRVRLAAEMTDLRRYGLPDTDVEMEIRDILSDIRDGQLSALEHPQTEIVRRLTAAALEFARRVLGDPALEAELVTHPESTDRMHQAITALPAQDRQLLHMYFREGKDLGAMANELGISYSRAAGQMFRILARLRAQVYIHRDVDTM